VITLKGRHLRNAPTSANDLPGSDCPPSTARPSGRPCNRTPFPLVTAPPTGIGFRMKARRQAYRNTTAPSLPRHHVALVPNEVTPPGV
jgi:hypothetical protein